MNSPVEDPRFIRFSWIPRSGRSKHGVSGEAHAGLSVYEGTLIGDDLFKIHTGALHPNGLAGLILRAAGDYPAFFVWGEEVGEGPDGEPLVVPVHSVPVPKSVTVTAVGHYAKPALKLWSEGPRDGTGLNRRFVQFRLREGSPYLPPDFTFDPVKLQKLFRGINGAKRANKRKKKKRKRR